jgi:hypothetical protein
VIDSSLRQVTVVPTSTVVSVGWNMSELRLMTGPAGADAVLDGTVAADSADVPQPARAPTAIINDAPLMRSLRRTG